MNKCVVVLAAGEGKRMKSQNAKVLQQVLFKPMISWVLDNVTEAGIEDACVVTGHRSEQVEEFLGGRFECALQSERLGTGHAVMQAEEFLREHSEGDVLILYGDAPFVSPETILQSYAQMSGAAAVIVTSHTDRPYGYGRILTGMRGEVTDIVEEKDADEQQKKIQTINAGIYWFQTEALLEALPKLSRDNAQGEFYLTDVIRVLIEDGKKVLTYDAPFFEILGANDGVQLNDLNEQARTRMLERHMQNGVLVPCRDGIIIAPDVEIGADTVVLPGCILKGSTRIGEGCVIGPNCVIEDSFIGDRSVINQSQICKSIVENDVRIGPFSQLRPDSHIKSGVKIGDFVEIKNSTIGSKTSVAHLTYVGDSDIGKNVNFGCGVVTVNYDGAGKFRTVVEDDAFIGCNTNLVAPVKIGKGAYTAAGTTVTSDVPGDALVIGRTIQTIKHGWALQKKKKEETL